MNNAVARRSRERENCFAAGASKKVKERSSSLAHRGGEEGISMNYNSVLASMAVLVQVLSGVGHVVIKTVSNYRYLIPRIDLDEADRARWSRYQQALCFLNIQRHSDTCCTKPSRWSLEDYLELLMLLLESGDMSNNGST